MGKGEFPRHGLGDWGEVGDFGVRGVIGLGVLGVLGDKAAIGDGAGDDEPPRLKIAMGDGIPFLLGVFWDIFSSVRRTLSMRVLKLTLGSARVALMSC